MNEFDRLPIRLAPMTIEDLPHVIEIERAAYPAPWSERAYEYELRYNEMAHYFVARTNSAAMYRNGSSGLVGWLKRILSPPKNNGIDTVIGYIGYWLMAGEAHISTIAVRPELRGRAYGELLLAYALQDALARAAHVATLEVRVSNLAAQQLYLKYSFEKVGMRKAYYADNNEDAYIMTTPPLHAPEYQEKLRRLRIALFMRLQENTPRPAPKSFAA